MSHTPMSNMSQNQRLISSKNQLRVGSSKNRNSKRRRLLQLNSLKLSHKNKLPNRRNLKLPNKKLPNQHPTRKLRPQGDITKRRRIMRSNKIRKIKPKKSRTKKMREKIERPKRRTRRNSPNRSRIRPMIGMKAKRSTRLG